MSDYMKIKVPCRGSRLDDFLSFEVLMEGENG